MKFRDGMWMVAEGVRAEYAEEVYSMIEREDGKALSLLCPTKKIRERFDSLNVSTLSIVSMHNLTHTVFLTFIGRCSSFRWSHFSRNHTLARST